MALPSDGAARVGLEPGEGCGHRFFCTGNQQGSPASDERACGDKGLTSGGPGNGTLSPGRLGGGVGNATGGFLCHRQNWI